MPRADPIVRADKVRLVDEDFSTDKRERVAKFIAENWNDNDLTLTEISNETGTSRQHVSNTLDEHFEIADGEQSKSDQQAIPTRSEVDTELLQIVLTAYRMGINDSQNDEVDPGISEELLKLATRE